MVVEVFLAICLSAGFCELTEMPQYKLLRSRLLSPWQSLSHYDVLENQHIYRSRDVVTLRHVHMFTSKLKFYRLFVQKEMDGIGLSNALQCVVDGGMCEVFFLSLSLSIGQVSYTLPRIVHEYFPYKTQYDTWIFCIWPIFIQLYLTIF